MKKDLVIGVLGGMGTYATIHLFQQYAEVFSAEKEWDRPRIVIDNRCTMPSRVRAFLFNENVDQLVDEMSDSMKGLVNEGCNRIILACNTSHLFLPQIYQRVPALENRVINIIEICVKNIQDSGIDRVYLLGSEGTIESNIYQDSLARSGIDCICPMPNEFFLLRDCIEAVKQNRYSEQVKRAFLELVNRNDACVLGCTELPILYERYKNEVSCRFVFDPLFLTLSKLKEEYEYE